MLHSLLLTLTTLRMAIGEQFAEKTPASAEFRENLELRRVDGDPVLPPAN